MQSAAAHMGPVSKKIPWNGRILSILAALFLVLDAVMHVMKPTPVVAAFAQLGYPIGLAVGIGILELACIAVYVFPGTSVLGAILLTGYLGGAVASHLRVGHSLFETVFPIIIAALLWAGLVLRDARLRALFAVRT